MLRHHFLVSCNNTTTVGVRYHGYSHRGIFTGSRQEWKTFVFYDVTGSAKTSLTAIKKKPALYREDHKLLHFHLMPLKQKMFSVQR